jgi:hypothetical protein
MRSTSFVNVWHLQAVGWSDGLVNKFVGLTDKLECSRNMKNGQR